MHALAPGSLAAFNEDPGVLMDWTNSLFEGFSSMDLIAQHIGEHHGRQSRFRWIGPAGPNDWNASANDNNCGTRRSKLPRTLNQPRRTTEGIVQKMMPA